MISPYSIINVELLFCSNFTVHFLIVYSHLLLPILTDQQQLIQHHTMLVDPFFSCSLLGRQPDGELKDWEDDEIFEAFESLAALFLHMSQQLS